MGRTLSLIKKKPSTNEFITKETTFFSFCNLLNEWLLRIEQFNFFWNCTVIRVKLW